MAVKQSEPDLALASERTILLTKSLMPRQQKTLFMYIFVCYMHIR